LSVYRSVVLSAPHFSMDAAGPDWVASSVVQPRLGVLRVVFDATGLPAPRSLMEAVAISADPRIASLRRDIDRWTERVVAGDFEEAELIREARRVARPRPSAAEQLTRITTYVSLPTAVIELLLGSSRAGLGLTALGATSQALSDLQSRQRRRSWTSLWRDFAG
jgi:hypothetical protein